MMQASSSWFRRCEGAWAIRQNGLPSCESATTAAHRARRRMARTEFLRLQGCQSVKVWAPIVLANAPCTFAQVSLQLLQNVEGHSNCLPELSNGTAT